jgi:hypothetical protein
MAPPKQKDGAKKTDAEKEKLTDAEKNKVKIE